MNTMRRRVVRWLLARLAAAVAASLATVTVTMASKPDNRGPPQINFCL